MVPNLHETLSRVRRVVPNLPGIWVGYRESYKTYPGFGYGYESNTKPTLELGRVNTRVNTRGYSGRVPYPTRP